MSYTTLARVLRAERGLLNPQDCGKESRGGAQRLTNARRVKTQQVGGAQNQSSPCCVYVAMSAFPNACKPARDGCQMRGLLRLAATSPMLEKHSRISHKPSGAPNAIEKRNESACYSELLADARARVGETKRRNATRHGPVAPWSLPYQRCALLLVTYVSRASITKNAKRC